jgi:osmotically-inducible protein OsmY
MRAELELQEVVTGRVPGRQGRTDPGQCGADVRRSIETALECSAPREAAHVHVAVENGYATLSGSVCSWGTWRLVHETAEGTPGVRSVDDQIQIVPDWNDRAPKHSNSAI